MYVIKRLSQSYHYMNNILPLYELPLVMKLEHQKLFEPSC